MQGTRKAISEFHSGLIVRLVRLCNPSSLRDLFILYI